MTKRIKLSQGKYALVDDEDYSRISVFKWRAYKNRNTWYARRSNGKSAYISMHHAVIEKNVRTDHKNGNGLDNRKLNLREATRSQNTANRKHYKNKYHGIDFHKKSGGWRARVCKDQKSYYIGAFKTQQEAFIAYNKKAIELFGEFASLNALEDK